MITPLSFLNMSVTALIFSSLGSMTKCLVHLLIIISTVVIANSLLIKRRDIKMILRVQVLKALQTMMKRECKSDEDNSEGDKKAKMGSFKKRAISAGDKFRHSIRTKRKKKSDNQVISIEDIRDVQELETVERFRRCLLDEGLLPERHDDYHMMLRYHIFTSTVLRAYLAFFFCRLSPPPA